MNIGVSGLIVNQSGEVLVIQRDDTRTWALPGGSLDPGESPMVGVAREVEEETGFKVLPVRLVSVGFATWGERNLLSFTFRCLLRGGQARTSAESLQVGFTPTNPLGVSMLPVHQKRIETGIRHKGGPPDWQTYEPTTRERAALVALTNVVYPVKNLMRRLRGAGEYVPPPKWKMGVFCVIRNENGEVLWAQRRDNGKWNLPGGGVDSKEAPWDAAVREVKEETELDVKLTDLTGVYTKAMQMEHVLVFTAEIVGGKLQTTEESADFQWLPADNPPENVLPLHLTRVLDAVDPERDVTVFRDQVRPA